MGDGQLDHNILKLNVIVILSVRKLSEDKAWYSIKKKEIVLIMIKASSTVSFRCTIGLKVWERKDHIPAQNMGHYLME